MNVTAYLQHIGYTEQVSVSLQTLNGLQRAHLLRVPFENLDIHLGRTINPEHSYRKVVEQGRGGFCYELNYLFYQLLSALGFDAQLLSARVYNSGTQQYGAEFDHMAVLVKLPEGNFLADVGFGEFTFHPLKIELHTLQHDERGVFVIEQADETYLVVKKQDGDAFTPEYIFTLHPRTLRDFATMCLFHQTSADSHFTQKRLCSLPVPGGRITLSGNTLKISSAGTSQETILENEAAFREALFTHFKVRI